MYNLIQLVYVTSFIEVPVPLFMSHFMQPASQIASN